MARRVIRDAEHSIRCVALSEEVGMCILALCANAVDARVRVLHFAIAAIRRAARKTSLKGHTRRVIRLYVTRSPPSRIQLNVMEMPGNFRQREFPYVRRGMGKGVSLPRHAHARGIVVLVLFFSFTVLYRWTTRAVNAHLTA